VIEKIKERREILHKRLIAKAAAIKEETDRGYILPFYAREFLELTYQIMAIDTYIDEMSKLNEQT